MAVPLSQLGAVVLAAGNAARMAGGDKLARPLAGMSLISHTLNTVSRVGLRQTVVVVRRDCDVTAQAALRFGCEVVVIPDAGSGMGHSLALGVKNLRADVRGCFVCLADMPFIAKNTFAFLTDALSDNEGDCIRIAAPTHHGRRGHPVLFANALFPELGTLRGDTGARDIIKANAATARFVDVDDAGVVFDIDTAEDFARAEAILAKR